jgi:hypothetical protein
MAAALVGCTAFTIYWFVFNGAGAAIPAGLCVCYLWYVYGKNITRRTKITLSNRRRDRQ